MENLYRYCYHRLMVTFTSEAPPEVLSFLEEWGTAGFTFVKAILFCYKTELKQKKKKKGVTYPSVEVLDWIKHNLADCG